MTPQPDPEFPWRILAIAMLAAVFFALCLSNDAHGNPATLGWVIP